MELPDHPAPPPPTPRGPSRAVWSAAILTALLVAAVAAVFAIRGDGQVAGSLPPAPSSPPATAAATTTIDPRTEVVARLREILRVREEAFAKRDASLLDQIYSDDCPCLKAGRDAITALRKENVVWKGRSISLLVQSTDEINEQLWEVGGLYLQALPYRDRRGSPDQERTGRAHQVSLPAVPARQRSAMGTGKRIRA